MKRILLFFTMIINLLLFVIGLIYESNGGLRCGIDEIGNLFFSNELMSSGGDDSGILSIGMMVFLIPAILGVFVMLKRMNCIVFNILQLVTIGIFGIILFMVNLDTSLWKSIELGDNLLLKSLIGAVFLFVSSSVLLIPELKKKLIEQIEFRKWIADEN